MNIKVSSVEEAWELADRLFPTDYEKDEERSNRAGYPIHYSTKEGVNAWISDLGNMLELNYYDGKSENILIEQKADDPSRFGYKIFITNSGDVASLIARGLREQKEPGRNFVKAGYGSTCAVNESEYANVIPGIYKEYGKFYAILVYRPENGENPEYELTIC